MSSYMQLMLHTSLSTCGFHQTNGTSPLLRGSCSIATHCTTQHPPPSQHDISMRPALSTFGCITSCCCSTFTMAKQRKRQPTKKRVVPVATKRPLKKKDKNVAFAPQNPNQTREAPGGLTTTSSNFVGVTQPSTLGLITSHQSKMRHRHKKRTACKSPCAPPTN